MYQTCVADNIKRIISEKGYKQTAIAQKAGHSSQQFSAIVCRRKVLKDTDIAAIANALNVTPNELFGIETRIAQAWPGLTERRLHSTGFQAQQIISGKPPHLWQQQQLRQRKLYPAILPVLNCARRYAEHSCKFLFVHPVLDTFRFNVRECHMFTSLSWFCSFQAFCPRAYTHNEQ